MKITKESQPQLGETYYYADTNSPKLEHQADGVAIYSCIWNDIAKEYKKIMVSVKKRCLPSQQKK